MPEKMTREEFCEICKEYGLEVVCEDNVYGPNSKHATAYIHSSILSQEKENILDWDCSLNGPVDTPWYDRPCIGFYDALSKNRQGLYHVSTSDWSDCQRAEWEGLDGRLRQILRQILKQVSSALHRLEEDQTYRPDTIVFSTAREHYDDNPRT